MKISNILSGTVIALAMALAGCTQDSPVTVHPEGWTPDEPVLSERGSFAKGADVSWVTEFESLGMKFRTQDGEEKELMSLLRDDCGVNSIRLRVWVDPTDGWNNLQDVLVKARRANDLGQRLMIDFHFSDTWADPGAQSIPAAWAEADIDGVLTAIRDHVTEVLGALAKYGIDPEWVQIGNETRTGMMWPLGDIDNGDNFTRMVNAGYDAVKAVCPEASVIVHCDAGDNQWIYDRLFGKLKEQGAKYDMIGMSLYPEPHNYEKVVDDCLANIDHVKATYSKPVMICEIGLNYREAEAADKMMRRLMEGCIAREVKGIFWWEPESPASRYDKGCFDENGAPTQALDCFKD